MSPGITDRLRFQIYVLEFDTLAQKENLKLNNVTVRM